MRISNSGDVASLLAPYFASQNAEEAVAVVHVDNGARVIGTTFSGGGADEAELPVREILGSALRFGAASIIVAHNHPSGDPSPSEQDLAATRRLAEAAQAAGIRLIDHLIFAGGEYRSLRELGLL
jgi:DNA repair protein RadC